MGFEKGGNVQVFGAALAGGFFGSVFSLPFDFVKTQLQKMKPDPSTGPITTITLSVQDRIKKLWTARDL